MLTGSLPQGNDVFSDTILITLPSGFPFSNHTESTIHVSQQYNNNEGTKVQNPRRLCPVYSFHVLYIHVHVRYSYTIGAMVYRIYTSGLVYGRARGRSPRGLRKLNHELARPSPLAHRRVINCAWVNTLTAGPGRPGLIHQVRVDVLSRVPL